MTLPSKNDTKIVLVEDYEIDARGVRELLIQAGYFLDPTNIYDNRTEAQLGLEKIKPHIVFIDLQIRGEKHTSKQQIEEGLALIRLVSQQSSYNPKVIAMSRYRSPWAVYQVATCGVSFVDKSDLPNVIPWIIDRVLEGNVVYSPAVIPILRQGCKSAIKVNFDDTDIEILKLIVKGATDRVISNQISYTEEMVAGRLRRMFKSYGFNEREQLATWFKEYVAPTIGIPLTDS